MTPASATAGCSIRTLSTSNGPMRCPADLMTSSARPTNQYQPGSVASHQIAGEVPAVREGRRGAWLVVQVAAEHGRPAGPERQFAFHAGLLQHRDPAADDLGPTVLATPQHRRFHTGQRTAHGAAGCRSRQSWRS